MNANGWAELFAPELGGPLTSEEKRVRALDQLTTVSESLERVRELTGRGRFGKSLDQGWITERVQSGNEGGTRDLEHVWRVSPVDGPRGEEDGPQGRLRTVQARWRKPGRRRRLQAQKTRRTPTLSPALRAPAGRQKSASALAIVLLRNGSKHVTGDAEDWRTLPASGCAQIPVPTRTQGATPGTARDTLIASMNEGPVSSPSPV